MANPLYNGKSLAMLAAEFIVDVTHCPPWPQVYFYRDGVNVVMPNEWSASISQEFINSASTLTIQDARVRVQDLVMAQMLPHGC